MDGFDPPEASCEALYQVAKCEDRIGWRNNTRRVIIIATDEEPHLAGDGAVRVVSTDS